MLACIFSAKITYRRKNVVMQNGWWLGTYRSESGWRVWQKPWSPSGQRNSVLLTTYVKGCSSGVQIRSAKDSWHCLNVTISLDCHFGGNESLMRKYCAQDLNELSAPNVYNGSELITILGIVDNRNGNEVPSIFQIRHRTILPSLARRHTRDNYNAGCREFFPSLLKLQDLVSFHGSASLPITPPWILSWYF